MKEKNENLACPTSLDGSWSDFSWDKYPGGVIVSFALTEGKKLLLLRPSRWNFVMPECSLGQNQVLADVLSWLEEHLGAYGVSAGNQSEVCAVDAVDGTFHVLVKVPCRQVVSTQNLERVDNALILGGYTVSNPMHRFVPRMLNWSDAHLIAA